MEVSPYSLTDGTRTLFGHTLMQSEQAVQLVVKFTILADPGGDTGNVLFSFTVDAFLGTGAVLFWPAEVSLFNPRSMSTKTEIAFRLPESVTVSLSIAPSFAGFLNDTKLYSKALSWQLFRQLKQPTHLELSISLFRKSIHDDLQATAHLPHFVHFDSSNLICSRETLEIIPRNVPTGQTALQ